MAEESKIGRALNVALRSDDARALATEYAEVGIDQLLEDGFARDVPVLGTLLGLAKIGVSIHDRLFSKKLLKFLGPLASIEASDRADMIDRLERDPSYGRKVGEHLVELIDRIEVHRKPQMLARVFLAYQRKEIDTQMLQRLNFAIESLPAFEIDAARLYIEGDIATRSVPRPSLQNLITAGLLANSSVMGGKAFAITEVGATFVKLALDKV
jgi:hypothetical protein